MRAGAPGQAGGLLSGLGCPGLAGSAALTPGGGSPLLPGPWHGVCARPSVQLSSRFWCEKDLE